MAYYSVLDVTPTTDAWILAYLPVTGKLVTKHGGKYVARASGRRKTRCRTSSYY